MKTQSQPNELENLLLDSLKQLSEEFEQREKRTSAQCTNCRKSFEQQSSALRTQYDEVSQRLDDLTTYYDSVEKVLNAIERTTQSLAPIVTNEIARQRKIERDREAERGWGR